MKHINKLMTHKINCLKKQCFFLLVLLCMVPVSQAAVELNFIQSDHLGTPRVLSDNSGDTVWRLRQTPFGETTIEEDPDGDGNAVVANLRFPGQYFDGETELHYNYFRYYDPKVGRYLTSDPIGLQGGLNTYAYVGGNPIVFFDLFGLDAQVTVWQPVGWGSSSFGHSSISVNGTTWSWGPGGMTTMPQVDYNSLNSFRGGVTSNIPLTPDQDASLTNFLNDFGGNYDPLTNSCVTPVQQGLQSVGVNVGNSIFPVSLGNNILNNNLANQFIFHTPTVPSTGSSAPWTR